MKVRIKFLMLMYATIKISNDKISASYYLISPLELLVELAETDLNLQESYSQSTSFTVTPPAGGSAIPVAFEITFTDGSATGGIRKTIMIDDCNF